MKINISYAPAEFIWDLQCANAPLAGKCYENCVIAVFRQPLAMQLQYILGFVTPPGHDTVAHAWLQHDTPNGAIYLDPTLQDASPLWLRQRNDFIYDKRFSLTREELVQWFRDKKPDGVFNANGVPAGSVSLPMINADGELAATSDFDSVVALPEKHGF